MRRCRVHGVTQQDDTPLVPVALEENPFERLVDDVVVLGNLFGKRANGGRRHIGQLGPHRRRKSFARIARISLLRRRDVHVHQLIGQRDKADPGRPFEGKQTIDIGGAPQIVAPHRLPREFGYGGVGKQLCTRFRIQAVRTDDDVVPFGRPVAERRGNAVAVIHQLGRRDAQPDCCSRRDDPIAEHLMQRAAAYAHVRGIALNQTRCRDARNRLSGRNMNIDVIEAEAGTDVIVDQTKLGHCADDITLLDNADPVDRPGGIALDHFDSKAFPAQCNCCRQAADSPTDHENFCVLHPSPRPSRARTAAGSLTPNRSLTNICKNYSFYAVRLIR